jgi:chromosome segregation ATPase
MSKEYYRNCIAAKREEIVKLRSRIADVKEHKSAKMAELAKRIKNTQSASTKETCRRHKISEAARFAKEVDSLKGKIEYAKKQIESYKKSLAAAK